MPRFNPFTGEAASGVAGGVRPSVDGVIKGAANSIGPVLWFDTDHIIHRTDTGLLAKTNVRTDTTTVISAGVVHAISAGCCGTYLTSGAAGLEGAITLPAGGVNRVTTDARGANSPDGSLLYVAVSAVVSPTIVRNRGGLEVELPDRYGMHLIRWGQAVWNESVGVLGFWGKTCAYIPGAQGAKLANIGGQLWIFYYLDGTGLIAHKAILPDVYHTIAAGGYHPDAIAFEGKLAVCYSTGIGEAPGELVKVMDVIGTSPTTPVPPDIIAGGQTVGPAIPIRLPEPEKLGKLPQFADLKVILAQTKDTENPLYQVVAQIIDRLTRSQGIATRGIVQANQLTGSGGGVVGGSNLASYHTKYDDRLVLPNSVQLLAGTGITFDDSVSHQRTINSTAAGGGGGGSADHYDCPLTDGDLIEAELIFAAGECIIVQVPI